MTETNFFRELRKIELRKLFLSFGRHEIFYATITIMSIIMAVECPSELTRGIFSFFVIFGMIMLYLIGCFKEAKQ